MAPEATDATYPFTLLTGRGSASQWHTLTRTGKSAVLDVTHGVQPKQVFVPMHYAGTNELTFPAFDPQSRQPAYKACAATVRPLTEAR